MNHHLKNHKSQSPLIGEEGHLQDEVRQSCWPIRCSSGDDQSSRWYRCYNDQHLAIAITRDGKVPADWEQSFIICLYKGKGDALDRGNYRILKLTEQAMNAIERIADILKRRITVSQVGA